MASIKQVPEKAAAAQSAPAGKAGGSPAATVSAHAAAAKTALAAAQGMPGWRRARTILGEALAAGDTAILLQARGQTVSLRRRVGVAWQQPGPLGGEDAAAAFAALQKLAVVTADGQQEPEFEVAAKKLAARSCRVAARAAAASQEVLVLLGAEIERATRPQLGSRVGETLGRLVPPFLKRKPAAAGGQVLPQVTLEPTGADAAARQAALAAAAGYAAACELVAAAVQARANAVVLESGPQGVAAKLDVDGIDAPAALDAAAAKAVAGVLVAAAGLDPQARGPQAGRIVAQVEGKPWPCTVTARRGSAGSRVELAIEQGRPKFKTLADTGMPDAVAERVQEALKLESGIILVVAPRRVA